MIELHMLRYVLAAAETGSFNRAAESFGIKQSTLSDSVRYLESRLGLALFNRSTRGVTPTHPGRRFLANARHILDDFERLLNDTKALAAGRAGTLRIGFRASLASGDLSASLTAFRQANRDVEIEAYELNRAALLSALHRDRVDLIVIAGRPPSATRSLCLWSERLVAALPADHPLAAREHIYWSDLKGVTFVVSADDPGPDIKAIIAARLSEAGHTPDVRVQRVGRDNLLTFAEGNSVVIGTSFPLRRGANAPLLHMINDGFAPTAIEQCVAWRDDNDSAPLRRFLTIIRERYALASEV